MERISGSGKTLPEIYASMFGPSQSAKAFRALVKLFKDGNDPAKELELATLAKPAVDALAESQEFKHFWNVYGGGLKIQWKYFQDPADFIDYNGWVVPHIKRILEVYLGNKTPKVSAATRKFLTEWVNTNGGSLPGVSRDIISELLPFRPQGPQILYRGIRFKGVGDLVQFHEKYSGGKGSFPFHSERFSSWTTAIGVAEKFGRYRSAVSQMDGMFQFFGRMKAQKDYSGSGGYIIGARVQPQQCLVDLSHPTLPFAGGEHGNEGEVIVSPDTNLVCKVYKIFGDIQREVDEYMRSTYENKTPLDKGFFGYSPEFKVVSVKGDGESGTIEFGSHPGDLPKTPRQINQGSLNGLEGKFQSHLYTMRWLDDSTVEYKRMTSAQKVAHIHSSCRIASDAMSLTNG